MSKISNVLSMLKILENGRVFKIKELSELLECSERSVRTYKEDMEKAGIYIESIPGRHGGYYYNSNKANIYFGVDKNDLNVLENVYLYLSNTNYKQIESLNNTIDKIRYALINSTVLEKNLDFKVGEHYSIVSDAINNSKRLSFIYKKSKIEFIPHDIYIYSNICFVTGINKKINQIRTYNLSELKNLKKI